MAPFGPLEGHSLGDGWPQDYWRRLAAQCDQDGFAWPVVKFLELLSELRTSEQLLFARNRMYSLSPEHLATTAGQIGGALLNLREADAPEDLVAAVASLYEMLVEEMDERVDRGVSPQLPELDSRLGLGGWQPERWRSLGSWRDLLREGGDLDG